MIKRLILIGTIVFTLTIFGCETPLGPRANPLGNRSDGHWKLTSLYKNKKQIDVSAADSLAYLKLSEYTKYDSAYQTNNMHYVFTFASPDFTESKVLDAIQWSYSSGPNTPTEVQWYAISKEAGFRILFHFVEGSNYSYQMDVTNVMNSSEYKADLDSIKYVYTPTEKF
ncbi:hypothetical protein [Dyadobacter sp.]|uniref:hypothetical protein n=1 Tax=Dyadobacter sp. TaxID=1914288 RepID=UPI003F71B45A